MAGDGELFLKYLLDNNVNKTALAKSLSMSRTNLYQLFETREFKIETITSIEKVLKIKFNDLKSTGNVNNYTTDLGSDLKSYKQVKSFNETESGYQTVPVLLRIIEKQQETIHYLTTGKSQGAEEPLRKNASG